MWQRVEREETPLLTALQAIKGEADFDLMF